MAKLYWVFSFVKECTSFDPKNPSGGATNHFRSYRVQIRNS
jgi:hypothetical protein